MTKRILKHNFSLLNTDYVRLGKKWNYSNVMSPYHRIYYIDGGFGKLSNHQQYMNLEPGFLYLIPSFTLCNLICPNYLSQFYVQFFEESIDGLSLFNNSQQFYKIRAEDEDISNFKRLVDLNPGRGINRSYDPTVYEKNIFYKEYQEHNNRQNIGDFLKTQGLLLELVSRFADIDIAKRCETKPIQNKIQDTLSFIALNLDQALSVNYLAERVSLNRDYFSRIFEKATDMRPVDYIYSKRIERAKYLIVTTPSKFSHIGEMTGFKSLSHFSRVFKQYTGHTALEFKKLNQQSV